MPHCKVQLLRILSLQYDLCSRHNLVDQEVNDSAYILSELALEPVVQPMKQALMQDNTWS